MSIRNSIVRELKRFWREEDGFIGGLVSAGLGLASSIFGNKSAKRQTQQVNQGFNYLARNPLVGEAQAYGSESLDRAQTAGGLSGALLGLGGDQAAAEAAFDQYRDSTGYNFRLDEGMRGIEGSRAARGILNSGATAKELTRFAQDTASEEYNRYLDQLNRQEAMAQSAASMGLGSAYQVGSAGSTAGRAAAGVEKDRSRNQMSGIGGLVRGVTSIFGF